MVRYDIMTLFTPNLKFEHFWGLESEKNDEQYLRAVVFRTWSLKVLGEACRRTGHISLKLRTQIAGQVNRGFGWLELNGGAQDYI
jgi:hypothetical protein